MVKEQDQPGAADIVSIYEVLNETRGELFIGATWRLKDLLGFQQMTPPAVVRHWELGDRLRFRTVEYGIPNADARAFIETYAKSDLVKAWKVVMDLKAA